MLRNLLSVAFVMASALTAFTACSSSDDLSSKTQADKDGLHTITMKLVGGCEQYDAKGQGRAAGETSVVWADGAKLYLQFSNGDKLVSGNATYSEATDSWIVSYYGSLAARATCQAYYFDNTTAGNGEVVQLSANSAIYEDANGAYVYDGENLSVRANLKPKTGRMRFTGTKGTALVLTGITHYASYDPATNTFFTSVAPVNATVDETSGYTPYIYGYFTDEESPSLGLVANGSEAYTMACPSTMYQAGESGYLDVPVESSHNGWATGLNFTVNGVSFKMIPVANDQNSFLIGETEVTEELYHALMDGTTSTPYKPIVDETYSSFLAFLTKLQANTSLEFRLPTATEWKFAAIGGKKTQNYKYSGSNTPSDVAWYSGNCSSIQNVKQKQPNELGIYDMSGNAAEFVDNGNSSPSYKYYYYYGGSYKSAASSITPTSNDCIYTYYSPSDPEIGIRLALTLK